MSEITLHMPTIAHLPYKTAIPPLPLPLPLCSLPHVTPPQTTSPPSLPPSSPTSPKENDLSLSPNLHQEIPLIPFKRFRRRAGQIRPFSPSLYREETYIVQTDEYRHTQGEDVSARITRGGSQGSIDQAESVVGGSQVGLLVSPLARFPTTLI
jgi:hypothetical protein